MELNLSKYTGVVSSLVIQKISQHNLDINKIEVFEYNGYDNFFNGDVCFLKCEKYEQKKDAKIFIDPDSPLKICVSKPKVKREKKENKSAQKKRQIIYERDGYKCLKCGEKDLSKLTLDHVIPISWGGKDNIKNLQTLCGNCNHKKGNKNANDYRNKF